ncbi:hypothetical protein GIB67_031261 [Kingdonia uniflora]|uniref:Oxidoreductase FAD/NAD(P)-binding domain-containing protein n=1 Tax=Kingdonia uniflora TaxID=39325 RepID=A0A7J7NYT4_9MAGN|nr:hypothetical protein GIB67_031261 [Kingdonia uniflora]
MTYFSNILRCAKMYFVEDKVKFMNCLNNIFGRFSPPPELWNGGVGFVSKEMIQTHCPAPAEDIQVLRCGPPPMNKAMAAHLDSLEYTSGMQFQF